MSAAARMPVLGKVAALAHLDSFYACRRGTSKREAGRVLLSVLIMTSLVWVRALPKWHSARTFAAIRRAPCARASHLEALSFSKTPMMQKVASKISILGGGNEFRLYLRGQAKIQQARIIWQPLAGLFAVIALVTALIWADSRRQRTMLSSPDRFSPREWVRMYRILGLGEEASKQQVVRATVRLRKKYAEDPEALERVEMANLWIMTRMVSRKEEAQRARRRAEFTNGQSLKRWLHENISAYAPAFLVRMLEIPSSQHFRRTSGLLGVFALLGLCAPSQAANFVGFGAASCLGLIHQRNRPEPVRDDMGHVGEVRKLNFKEMGAAIAVVAISALFAAASSICQQFLFDVPFQVIFCVNACVVFWLAALFVKVYQVFES